MSNQQSDSPHSEGETPATVLAVRAGADGYWYIGAGRSIAEGPYRSADHLLTVASDLLADQLRWRIDVFDDGGNMIISYSSEELDAGELHPVSRQQQWSALARGAFTEQRAQLLGASPSSEG